MTNEIYRTYKFYDEQGRRLSIFASGGLHNPDLVLVIITCSKGDNFSKKFAREAFNTYVSAETASEINVNPTVVKIPIIDGKPYYSFIKYCNTNFLKKMTVKVTGLQDTLYKPNVTATFKKLIGPTRWLNNII